MRDVETDRWAPFSDEQMAHMVLAHEIVDCAAKHHRLITDTFLEMYRDVALKRTPVLKDLSFFRARPKLQRLEQIMDAWVTLAFRSKAKANDKKGINSEMDESDGMKNMRKRERNRDTRVVLV